MKSYWLSGEDALVHRLVISYTPPFQSLSARLTIFLLSLNDAFSYLCLIGHLAAKFKDIKYGNCQISSVHDKTDTRSAAKSCPPPQPALQVEM